MPLGGVVSHRGTRVWVKTKPCKWRVQSAAAPKKKKKVELHRSRTSDPPTVLRSRPLSLNERAVNMLSTLNERAVNMCVLLPMRGAQTQTKRNALSPNELHRRCPELFHFRRTAVHHQAKTKSSANISTRVHTPVRETTQYYIAHPCDELRGHGTWIFFGNVNFPRLRPLLACLKKPVTQL